MTTSPQQYALTLFSDKEKMMVYTNIIDMFYNYSANQKYHTSHFSDLESINMNTPGLVAAHQFAEYLMRSFSTTTPIEYKDALDLIIKWGSNIRNHKYVGMLIANTTWRISQVYRGRAGRDIFKTTFEDVCSNKVELDKDIAQLRLCAYLLKLYVNEKSGKISLPPCDSEIMTEKNFPIEIQPFMDMIRNKSDRVQTLKVRPVTGKRTLAPSVINL